MRPPDRKGAMITAGLNAGTTMAAQSYVDTVLPQVPRPIATTIEDLTGLLAEGQPVPECNCGLAGDAESIASLTGIEKNLLPYWLTRYPDHEFSRAGSAAVAAKQVRALGEAGDPLALAIFGQQAMAVGRLFTIAANFTDPDIYFLGGGVVEATPRFRAWFLNRVREHTLLRKEQAGAASVALVPDRDMAGARGSAIAARAALQRA
jgi:glucokinase